MTDAKFVDVDGHRISVRLLGEGENLIVMLHGYGVLAPALEYKALSGLLAKDYKVLVVELFGYGSSDCVDKERTIENIVSELHEVISAYSSGPCILMGHSISGVYALYYANQYPDEVLAFVGIDSSVPKQNDRYNMLPLNLLVVRVTRLLKKTNLIKLMAKKSANYLPAIDTVNWPPDEAGFFKRLFVERNANDTVLNELRHGARNFKLAYDMKFSKTTPVLCFLSQQTCKTVKIWEKLHRDIVQEKEKSKILIYEGAHFLHYSHPRQIANATCSWLQSAGL